jgi:hypothetical protein
MKKYGFKIQLYGLEKFWKWFYEKSTKIKKIVKLANFAKKILAAFFKSYSTI